MAECKHIVGFGYLNYFDETDGRKEILTEDIVNEIVKRFGKSSIDLILENFKFCPRCGVKYCEG